MEKQSLYNVADNCYRKIVCKYSEIRIRIQGDQTSQASHTAPVIISRASLAYMDISANLFA